MICAAYCAQLMNQARTTETMGEGEARESSAPQDADWWLAGTRLLLIVDADQSNDLGTVTRAALPDSKLRPQR
jgi:hypothetical protein